MELCIPSGPAKCCWCRKISRAVPPCLSQWCNGGNSECLSLPSMTYVAAILPDVPMSYLVKAETVSAVIVSVFSAA